jgi:hypothetical protein
MPCPSHPPWLDHSNYTWRTIQVMKLLIMQFSPTTYHFIPLRLKYSPQHPVLRHPILILIHECFGCLICTDRVPGEVVSKFHGIFYFLHELPRNNFIGAFTYRSCKNLDIFFAMSIWPLIATPEPLNRFSWKVTLKNFTPNLFFNSNFRQNHPKKNNTWTLWQPTSISAHNSIDIYWSKKCFKTKL